MRDDAAQIQAIEAILVAVALVGSATMVVMYSQPASPPDGSRQSVGNSVEDSMDTLLDAPMALPGYGDSELSRAIALCLMDDCERLNAAIAGSLPAGARFNAYLSNGYGEIPLITNESPDGEAVAITRLVEPKWSYTFLGFDYNYTDPTLAQPLNVFALPVLKSNALTEGGTPVGVTVSGLRKDTGEEVRFTAFGSTLQRADARSPTTPAVSVFFVEDGAPSAFLNRTGAPTYTGDYSPVESVEDAIEDGTGALAPTSLDDTLGDATGDADETLDDTTGDASDSLDDTTGDANDTLADATDGANETLDNTTDDATDAVDGTTDSVTNATEDAIPGHPIIVRVVNSGDAKVAAGTPLRVELPRDWSAEAPVGDNAAWLVHANATDWNGTHARSHVHATLANDLLPNESVELKLKAKFHGSSEDYRLVSAEFGTNARARAEAVLRGADHPVPPVTDQPYLALNVPKPMGLNQSTTWTLGFVAPLVTQDPSDATAANPEGLLDVGVTVTRIDVWGWNQHGLFGNVTNVTGLDAALGEWDLVDGNFTWRGNVDVHRDSPLSMRFNATAVELLNPPIARAVGAMPVEFDAWRAKLVEQFEYGFLRGSVYPGETGATERPGHETDTGTHMAAGVPQWQGEALRGVGKYHVRELVTYRDAAAGGWIKPDQREVRIGESLTLESDVGSLLRNLQDTGSSNVNVTLRVYGPFTVEKKEPIWERSLTTSGDGEAVTDLVTWDVNADGYGDVIVGTSLGRVYAIDGLTGTVDESRLWDADPTLVEPPAIVRLVRGTWNGTPALYVGTAAEGNAPRVHALDANLTTLAALPGSLGEGRLLALHPGEDYDGDGVANVLASFTSGTTYRLSTTPNAAGAIAAVALHNQGAAGAVKLAALEHLGVNGPAGAVIATDASEGEGAIGAVALTDTRLEHAGGSEIVLEALLSPHNLATVDANGTTRWDLPFMPVTATDAFDADADADSDVAVGLRTGHVLAIDGEHGNALMTPLRFKGNLRVIDSDATNAHEVAFLTEEGGVGLTRDGWNTIECVCDPVTGQLITIPNAVSITRDSQGGIHVAHGDGLTRLQETVDGFTSAPISFDDVDFSNAFLNVSGTDVQIHSVKSVESTAGVLLAGVDVTCEIAAQRPCSTLLLRSGDQGNEWRVVETGTGESKVAKDQEIVCDQPDVGQCVFVNDGTIRLIDVSLGESRGVFDLEEFEAGAEITAAACRRIGTQESCLIGARSGALHLVDNPWNPSERTVKKAGGVDAVVKAIKHAGDGVVYAAGDNVVFASWDGGHSFRRLHLPVGAHVPSAIHAFPNGQAYVMGGTASEMQVLVARSYQRVTEATGAIPLDGVNGLVKNVSLAAADRFLANSSNVNGSWIQYYLKDADGAWAPLARLDASGRALSIRPGADKEYAKTQAMTLEEFMADAATHAPFTFQHAQDLDALEWRAVLHASPDVPAAGPRVFNLTFGLDLVAPDTGDALPPRIVQENFTDPQTLANEAATADVDTASGVIAAPLANLHWSQDVKGEVTDLVTADVTGDDVRDVIVGTGAVLSVTDSSTWSSDIKSLFKEIGTDNRVYVLDPALKGFIRWHSGTLDGKVTHVDLARGEDGNATVLATAVAENKSTRVYAFDAATGKELWSQGLNRPASALTHIDAALTRPDNAFAFPIVGTEGATPRADGTVFALEGERGERMWRTAYGEVGHYRVPVTLDDSVLFGPHVVEIEVSWVDSVAGSTTTTVQDDVNATLEDATGQDDLNETVDNTVESLPGDDTVTASSTVDAQDPVEENVTAVQDTLDDTARELVQAARYYNYFTAVPPDGRMPVSPVYALKIEAWLADWDYTAWTPTPVGGDDCSTACAGDGDNGGDGNQDPTESNGQSVPVPSQEYFTSTCELKAGAYCRSPAYAQ